MTPNKSNSVDIDVTLDPVVEEVRERGRILTERFNNDPQKLFEQLRYLAQKHPEKIVGQLRIVAVVEAGIP